MSTRRIARDRIEIARFRVRVVAGPDAPLSVDSDASEVSIGTAAGQSLLYSLSSGVGGVLGALLSSWLWEWRGGAAAFLGGAVVVALAWAVYALRPRALTDPVAG